jgi:gas vesicle structural protein
MSIVSEQQSAMARTGGRSSSSSLYDVLELILDRGLVIDVFVRVSLVGIEILKIDARVVVASVDTYLRFAEACNRLDLESGPHKSAGLPELVGSATEGGARGKTKGALTGAAQTIADSFRQAREGSDDRQEEKEEKPRTRRTSGTSTRRKEESE